MRHSPIHTFIYRQAILLLVFLPFLQLFWGFSLLYHRNFEAMLDQYIDILITCFFWKPYMKLGSSTHPRQIKYPITNYCICVKDLVEFAEFEEDYLLKVILLNLPILLHAGCKLFPLSWWYVNRRLIVARLSWSLPTLVLNVLLQQKVRSRILYFLDGCGTCSRELCVLIVGMEFLSC